ncbi:MAG TPA: Hpt domain-containing protein, partial [Bacillales bacterium]|nr:Hpt domain-containing protein [Bacillales bacterium]
METDQYLDVFLDESREHLQLMNDGLLRLEGEPEEISVVQEIFRGAHTLKGMSATMGFSDMAELTHKLENVLDAVRNGELAVTTDVVDVLLKGTDELEAMTDDIAGGGDGGGDIQQTVVRLNQLLNLEVAVSTADTNGSDLTLDEYERTVI